MKVSELIEILKDKQKEKGDIDILVSSDEELNILFEKFEVCYLSDIKKFCIFGLSGCELKV